ncbi:MAG TPA: (2Fe-2S)-binding protein [Rhodothermia bacterium]
MEATIRFTLNSEPVEITVDGDRPLLWVLRSDLASTGTKFGCGEGFCGTCTVLVDGLAERSCLLTANDVEGKSVTTIEGLAQNGNLHPLQEAFIEHGALQCGYCTPGMILAAHSLLARNPQPTAAEIVAELDENYCRCGAHVRVVAAIQSAAETMRSGGTDR